MNMSNIVNIGATLLADIGKEKIRFRPNDNNWICKFSPHHKKEHKWKKFLNNCLEYIGKCSYCGKHGTACLGPGIKTIINGAPRDILDKLSES